MKDFWGWRSRTALESENKDDYEGELSEFGRWMQSANLEDEWVLEQVQIVMVNFPRLHVSEESISRLVKISDRYPPEALDIIQWLFDSKTEPWDYYLWRKPTMELLGKMLGSEVDGISKKALSIINHVVAMGHLEYRELTRGGAK